MMKELFVLLAESYIATLPRGHEIKGQLHQSQHTPEIYRNIILKVNTVWIYCWIIIELKLRNNILKNNYSLLKQIAPCSGNFSRKLILGHGNFGWSNLMSLKVLRCIQGQPCCPQTKQSKGQIRGLQIIPKNPVLLRSNAYWPSMHYLERIALRLTQG